MNPARPAAAAPPTSAAHTLRRANRAFGPIMAGMIIDLVDLATFGPIGLVLGLPIGGLAGYWLGSSLGLDHRARWMCAALAGLYCTIPFTEVLPLGTLVGAYARFTDSSPAPAGYASPRRPAAPDTPNTDMPAGSAPIRDLPGPPQPSEG